MGVHGYNVMQLGHKVGLNTQRKDNESSVWLLFGICLKCCVVFRFEQLLALICM